MTDSERTGIAVLMQVGGASRVWFLALTWLVMQLAPSLFLVGISLGDHTLVPAEGGSLLLRHEEGHTEAHHGHSPLERLLVAGLAGREAHEDHLVRLPDVDPASRSGLPDGIGMPAVLASPGPILVTPPFRTVPTGSRLEIGPAPPRRSLPLLL